MKISPGLVRDSLSAHTWLGLAVGGLMYIICLSGALLVFHAELERWEQPDAPEFLEYDPAGAERALNAALANPDLLTPHMYLVTPTPDMPRMRIATEDVSWFLNADGSRGPDEENQFSEMLMDLHLYLHLPSSWGIILVSTLGALLVGLIISGLLAHPRIFRDAFRLRRGGNRLLTQADYHNRLSVWGLPFYLLIAVTGAYFGLALPNLALVSEVFYDGDRAAVVAAVFGDEPELSGPGGSIAVAQPMQQLKVIAPDAQPLMAVVHEAAQPNQFLSIAASHPDRLIYAENYLFDARGEFLRSDGFLDGPAGKQVVYSIYQLHFGQFAGIWVKLAYALLGLALTVISATGINVWLARRGVVTVLDDVWTGLVWGLPLSISLSAAATISFGLPPGLCLWTTLIAAMLAAVIAKDPRKTRRGLQIALLFSLALLILAHGIEFGRAALDGVAGAVNLVLVGLTATLALWLRYESTSSEENAGALAEEFE